MRCLGYLLLVATESVANILFCTLILPLSDSSVHWATRFAHVVSFACPCLYILMSTLFFSFYYYSCLLLLFWLYVGCLEVIFVVSI